MINQTEQILQEVKEKIKNSDIDIVIISQNRYFGLDFGGRTIKEITFKEAFGLDFFDWGLNFAFMSERNKRRYEEARGLNGCGFSKFFNKQNDLFKMNKELLKEQNLIIQKNRNKGVLK